MHVPSRAELNGICPGATFGFLTQTTPRYKINRKYTFDISLHAVIKTIIHASSSLHNPFLFMSQKPGQIPHYVKNLIANTAYSMSRLDSWRQVVRPICIASTHVHAAARIRTGTLSRDYTF
ncbi:hypothetical protein N7G274_008295 [Stereocaulon virgatum]|uniref:Uncharacterized protein n=1 Tax=Stereocaulon virgatum TaxID=373712 RepID=A0ABR4A1L4_9LECA